MKSHRTHYELNHCILDFEWNNLIEESDDTSICGRNILKARKTKNLSSQYFTQNSIQLTDRLKNQTLPPNTKLILFDVTSLYTNVPLTPTFERINNILQNS